MEDFIKLACCVLIPPVLSTLLVYLYVYAFRNRQKLEAPRWSIKKRTKDLFTFNPDKGLSHQPPLWLAFLIPLSYFLTLGVISWWSHSIELTAKGFNSFIEISKLPLGLLSLCIPLAVLVSRLHATQQTANQITVTKQKNNVDAFYAHRKAMAEYFSYIAKHTYEGGIAGDFQYHPRLHLKFFSHQDPNKGIPLPKTEKFEECFTLLDEARNNIGKMIELEFHSETYKNCLAACQAISKLADTLVIPSIYNLHVHWEHKEIAPSPIITIGNSVSQVIGAYRYARSYMRILCEFSGYDTSWFDATAKDSTQRKADKATLEITKNSSELYSGYFINHLVRKGYYKT
nr:hypothetical protein [uncultured Pseudomonas sp.]